MPLEVEESSQDWGKDLILDSALLLVCRVTLGNLLISLGLCCLFKIRRIGFHSANDRECFILYSQHLEQCLAHCRFSISVVY